MSVDFSEITESSGAPATPGQIGDAFQRYRWAAGFTADRRVLEVACGTGQGLGLLARNAASVVGCDIEPKSIELARRTYGDRIRLHVAPAEKLPVADGAADVVLLFEALYYLKDAGAFLRECARVLSADGLLLLTTTNRDLFDFSPSPYSNRYYGAKELGPLLAAGGFACELFGASRTEALPLRHRVLRPAKAVARRLGLVPKTMRGKALVRRVLFGPLPRMPHDLSTIDQAYAPPVPLSDGAPDTVHRFLYVVGRRKA